MKSGKGIKTIQIRWTSATGLLIECINCTRYLPRYILIHTYWLDWWVPKAQQIGNPTIHQTLSLYLPSTSVVHLSHIKEMYYSDST